VASFVLFVVTQFYKLNSSSEVRPVVLPLIAEDDFLYVESRNSFFKHKHSSQKIDWHDYALIHAEKRRAGPGEQGRRFQLTEEEDIRRNQELLQVNGYYAVVSDSISANRSIADIRHPL